MIAAVWGALFLLSGVHSVQEQPPIQPRVLVPSATRTLGVPPFSFVSEAACDKDGNLYFHVGSAGGIEILRLGADGSEGEIFKPSDQYSGESKAVFGDFSVTPGGTLYVLAGIEGKARLLRFDGDGNMKEPIVLDLPQGVVGTNIVASDSGMVLFFGFYDDTAPTSQRGKSYLGLLERSGMVSREVHLSVPGVNVAKLASGEALPPGATLSDDGNFYFASSNELLAISPGGELVRRIPFDNPEAKSSVSGVHVSGHVAVIDLARVDNHYVHKSYLVLETATGGAVGFYKPSEQLGGIGEVCFSTQQGLTFMKFESGQVKLLTAPLQ